VKDSGALRTIAFLIVVWTMITLAISIPNLYFGPEEKPPSLPRYEGANYTAGSGSSGFGRIMFMIFTGSLIAMSVLYIIISILRKDKEAFKEILGGLLVLIVVSGFFMSALYVMEHPNVMGMQEKNETGSAGNSTVKEKYEVAGPFQYIAVLFGVAIIGIVLLKLAMSFRSPKMEKVESQSEELKRKMALAINDLKKGKEVQEVIIRCYDEMCKILSKSSGMKEGDSMTPREFERAILSRMEIKREPVERLTALFEEAKYSIHPIDNSKRKEAIHALESLKGEVERWEAGR